jgi:hypothetical protein
MRWHVDVHVAAVCGLKNPGEEKNGKAQGKGKGTGQDSGSGQHHRWSEGYVKDGRREKGKRSAKSEEDR